jgi:predicted P-loop ATPase
MSISVLPPPAEGLRPLLGIHEHQRYLTTGFFEDGVARSRLNVFQAPTLFQDADLVDYILGYDKATADKVRAVSEWFSPDFTKAFAFRKAAAAFAKSNAKDLVEWMTSAVDSTNANIIGKVWLHLSEEAADTLDDLLDDQLDYIGGILKTIKRLPAPTVISRSGYGHHLYWWLQDGQGLAAGAPATSVAAVDRVNRNIAQIVNRTASFNLFDPAVSGQIGQGYCREIGSLNTKGRTPREVTALSYRPGNRVDLRTLTLPVEPVAKQEAAGENAFLTAALSAVRRAAGPRYEILDPETVVDFGDEALSVEDWVEREGPGASAKVCCPFSASSTVGSAKIYVNDKGVVFLNCWAAHHNHPHHDGTKALYIHDPTTATATAPDRRTVVDLLRLNKDGAPQPGSLVNLQAIVRESPEYKGKLWWSERRLCVMIGDRPIRGVDVTAFQIYCETNFGIIERSVDVILSIFMQDAMERPRNEIKEWWESVPWDGEERLETWLIDAAGIEDTPLHRAYSRRFLVSVVARVYWPGCKLDQVLLLMGSQGAKKSTLFRKLVGDAWFSDTFMDLGNKDAYMQLYKAVIYEWSENFKGGQLAVEREKAFITSQSDTFRPPYGKTVDTFDRHTVIVATSNLDYPLADPTGSRRWWPVVVADKIDLEWIVATRNQLWAEALIHFKKHMSIGPEMVTGYEWWIEKGSELDNMRAAQADKYTKEDPRMDAVVLWAKKRAHPFTLVELGEQVLAIPTNDVPKHAASLTQLLKDCGCARLARKRDDGGKRTAKWLSPHLPLPAGAEFATKEDAARHAKNHIPTEQTTSTVVPFPKSKSNAAR